MNFLKKLKNCFKCPLSICYLGIELILLAFTYSGLMSLKDFCITVFGYLFFNLVWSWIGLRAEQVNGIKLF